MVKEIIERIRLLRWRLCCQRASLIIDAMTIELEELRERIAELERHDA